MREILFKAKTEMIVGAYNCGKDDGEWVQGHLWHDTGKWMIRQFEYDRADYVSYEVNPDTICQYTGLTDKNGSKIWENDILQFEDVGEDDYNEGFDFVNRARVEFSEARWSLTDFVCNNSSVMEEMYDHLEFMELWQYCEVVGNFFDNDGILGGI